MEHVHPLTYLSVIVFVKMGRKYLCNRKLKDLLLKPYLITQVNNLLRIFPQCAQLELERILHVYSGVEINEHSRKFSVVIITQPGSGVLEDTLIRNFRNDRSS